MSSSEPAFVVEILKVGGWQQLSDLYFRRIRSRSQTGSALFW